MERTRDRVLQKVLLSIAEGNAEGAMEKMGEWIPRSIREIILVAEKQAGPESEATETVRVNPIVPQPGAVKPLYLEFIRAKERGLVGKEVTWKEYQIDGHQGKTE